MDITFSLLTTLSPTTASSDAVVSVSSTTALDNFPTEKTSHFQGQQTEDYVSSSTTMTITDAFTSLNPTLLSLNSENLINDLHSTNNLSSIKTIIENSPNIFLNQMLGTLTSEVLNASTEWLNESTATTSSSTTPSSLPYDESGYVPYTDRLETYIVPVLFAIIFIIGVLGNGVLILIFLRHRTMRNVPNMYICSLAVGDILVIFFCVPFTSTVYTVDSWPYGLLVCKFSEFIKDVSIGVSVFTLTALSADRYFAIVDPMRKLTGCRATRVTCITIIGIWILSIVLALPSVLFSYVRVIDGDPTHTFKVCYPFPPELGDTYPKIMVMFKFLVYYAIPLVFIATFYIIMAHHLVLSTKDMPGEIHGQTKQIQARKKVAKMVLSFVVIFAICFFPSHVFLLWFYYSPNSEENFNAFWNCLRIIGFCLGFINSCINPITLYCLSGTFRKHYNRHLFCCLSKPERLNPRGRNLLACGACVSMSNSAPFNGHGHGSASTADPHRTRNGSILQNRSHFGHGGIYRTTTMTGTQRKCTWDSSVNANAANLQRQILLSNLNVVNLTAGGENQLSNENPALAATAEVPNNDLHNNHLNHHNDYNNDRPHHNESPSSKKGLSSLSSSTKDKSPKKSPNNNKYQPIIRNPSLLSDTTQTTNIRQISLEEDLSIMTTSFINNPNLGDNDNDVENGGNNENHHPIPNGNSVHSNNAFEVKVE